MALTLKVISNTATDLGSKSPFGVGFDAVAFNGTAGSLIVQTSSDNGVTDAWATAATCGAAASATQMQPVTLKRWVRVSTAATMFLIAG